MTGIKWSTEVNAPCCPGEIINLDNPEQTILVQVDTDYPGIAETFGWSIRSVQACGCYCHHSSTDGTITCPECNMSANNFIAMARGYLESNNGAIADDPGYFME